MVFQLIYYILKNLRYEVFKKFEISKNPYIYPKNIRVLRKKQIIVRILILYLNLPRIPFRILLILYLNALILRYLI